LLGRLAASLFFALIATTLAPRAALAADEPPAPPPNDGEIPEGDIPPESFVWRPWIMFDPYLEKREALGDVAWIRERGIGTSETHDGFALYGGTSIESQRSVFLVRGRLEYGIRWTTGGHFVIDLARYVYAGGFRVGPVEATVQAGVALFDIHFGPDKAGLGGLSPHTGAALAFHLGKFRIEAHAGRDYAWRWTGGPTDYVQSAGIVVGIGSVPGLPPRFRLEDGP
jgi:hypothetical protein